MYSKEQLLDVLQQYKYPDFMIDKTVERLNEMQPEIKLFFDKWFECKETPKDEINGFTFDELTSDKYRFTPINAFLTLNWLLIDPQNATAALMGGIR